MLCYVNYDIRVVFFYLFYYFILLVWEVLSISNLIWIRSFIVLFGIGDIFDFKKNYKYLMVLLNKL